MSQQTNSQKMAQAAWTAVSARSQLLADKNRKEYRSFTLKFPSLIHTCGLAQAIAFAQAKGAPPPGRPNEFGPEVLVLEDLRCVLNAVGYDDITDADRLGNDSRAYGLPGYIRLSRNAISAAVWLKRYVEARFPEDVKESE